MPPPPPPPPVSLAQRTISTNIPPDQPEGTLVFSVRTAAPRTEKTSPGEVRIDVNVHSYPPTPPVAPSPSSSQILSGPSAHEINLKLNSIAPPKPSTVTRFVLYPSLPNDSSAAVSQSPIALFSRALSYITPTLPIRPTASFTLLPALSRPGDMAVPLLTFTDRTPTFSVLTTGLLEINKGLERQMSIDPAFWVTVALAYLEFLAERDVRRAYIMRLKLTFFCSIQSYLAASNG